MPDYSWDKETGQMKKTATLQENGVLLISTKSKSGNYSARELQDILFAVIDFIGLPYEDKPKESE